MQPRPGEGPLVFDRRRRQVQRRGGLLDAQAGEVAEGDDLAFARVHLLELLERFIERDEVGCIMLRLWGGNGLAVELSALLAAAVLDPIAVAGALDEDAPHRQGGS